MTKRIEITGPDQADAVCAKGADMAAVKYKKADWTAEADIQRLEGGKYQGVVLISRENGSEAEQSQHTVASFSDTPQEALDEAKALAHRILGDL
jgi:hypothetical protein